MPVSSGTICKIFTSVEYFIPHISGSQELVWKAATSCSCIWLKGLFVCRSALNFINDELPGAIKEDYKCVKVHLFM